MTSWALPHDEAFEAMDRAHRPALLALCRARLRDRTEAEDACQETLLRAYRSIARYDQTQPMWPWLATIAINVCTDMQRKRQAMPLSSLDADPRASITVDPGDELDRRARRRLVGSVLGELPAGRRTHVYLADAEGWSYADIAAREQRSVPSVRSSIMRGRSEFRARARARAEEHGLWPLAAVPLTGLRGRWLAWRAEHDADVASAVNPAAVSIAQVAAAAAVVLSVVLPSGAGPAHLTAAAPVVADRVRAAHAAPAAPKVALSPGSAAPTAASAMPAPAAVDVDLGDRLQGVGVDAETKERSRLRAWLSFRCQDGTERSVMCRVADALPVRP